MNTKKKVLSMIDRNPFRDTKWICLLRSSPLGIASAADLARLISDSAIFLQSFYTAAKTTGMIYVLQELAAVLLVGLEMGNIAILWQWTGLFGHLMQFTGSRNNIGRIRC